MDWDFKSHFSLIFCVFLFYLLNNFLNFILQPFYWISFTILAVFLISRLLSWTSLRLLAVFEKYFDSFHWQLLCLLPFTHTFLYLRLSHFLNDWWSLTFPSCLQVTCLEADQKLHRAELLTWGLQFWVHMNSCLTLWDPKHEYGHIHSHTVVSAENSLCSARVAWVGEARCWSFAWGCLGHGNGLRRGVQLSFLQT